MGLVATSLGIRLGWVLQPGAEEFVGHDHGLCEMCPLDFMRL